MSFTGTTTAVLDLHMGVSEEEKSDLIIKTAELMVVSSSKEVGFRRPSMTTAKAVRFGNVSIREFPVVVGDNPGGTSGPPISIGWEHHSEVTVDLVSYEGQRPPRRRGREMLIPLDVRFERLRIAGYSRSEIVTLTKPVNVARSQRKRTLDTLHLQPFQRFNENLARKTKSLLTGGRRKKQEKKLLQSFQPELQSVPSTASSQSSFKSAPSEEDQATDEIQSFDEISPVNSEDSELMI